MADMTGQLFGGNWTEQKLEILKKYLDAYNTALKNQPFNRIYIDAFAGTGYRQGRKRKINTESIFKDLEDDDSQNFLKGSAKLALEANPSFNKYIFIESDQNKIKELEKLKEEHTEKAETVDIIQDDANGFLKKYCSTENWGDNRAVLFLDPFATEVEWSTVEAVANTESIDVWILFPLMAVNRLLANNHEKIFYDRLNTIFGTNEWFESFYETQTLEDIFGESLDIIKKKCNFKSIGKFYKNRLKSIFTGVAEETRIFNNSCNSPLFQLFFAVGNPKGKPIAINIAGHLLRNI